MVSDKCPVCGSNADDTGASRSIDGYDVRCPRCGAFSITRSARVMLNARLADNSVASARISHYVATHQNGEDEWFTITSDNIDHLAQFRLPKVRVQRTNLLRLLALEADDDAQRYVEVDPGALAGRVGAKDGDAVETLLAEAEDEGLVEYLPDQSYRLTHKGWAAAEPSAVPAIVNRSEGSETSSEG